MIELLIKIGNDNLYEDGDILCVFNNDKINNSHIRHLCKSNQVLLEFYLNKTSKYLFNRKSSFSVERTNLETNDLEEYEMDVVSYVSNKKNNIFGTKGKEYWFSGRRTFNIR